MITNPINSKLKPNSGICIQTDSDIDQIEACKISSNLSFTKNMQAELQAWLMMQLESQAQSILVISYPAGTAPVKAE